MKLQYINPSLSRISFLNQLVDRIHTIKLVIPTSPLSSFINLLLFPSLLPNFPSPFPLSSPVPHFFSHSKPSSLSFCPTSLPYFLRLCLFLSFLSHYWSIIVDQKCVVVIECSNYYRIIFFNFRFSDFFQCLIFNCSLI